MYTSMMLDGVYNCFGYWIIVIYAMIIIVKGEDQFARKGDNVTLTCPYSGSALWNKVSGGFIVINRGTKINQALPNRDRLSTVETSTGNRNLHITSVTDLDTGRYHCAVGRQSKIINLKLYDSSLVLNAEVNSSNAYEGAAVEMKCWSDANPLSTVVWVKLDTQTILKTEKNVTQSVYMISSTSCRDTGQYMCSAFSGIGTSSNKTLDLDIQCKPKIMNRQRNVEDMQIEMGSKVELTLSIVSNPAPTIKWLYKKTNDEEIQPVLFASIEEQHSGVVFITKLKKEITTKDDIGMYMVRVVNSYGSDTYTFRLQERSSTENGTQCNGTWSVSTVVVFVAGASLGTVGICFMLGTVIIIRRKFPTKKSTVEGSPENAVQLYEGIIMEEVNNKGNTYDDLKEIFPSKKHITGISGNAAQLNKQRRGQHERVRM